MKIEMYLGSSLAVIGGSFLTLFHLTSSRLREETKRIDREILFEQNFYVEEVTDVIKLYQFLKDRHSIVNMKFAEWFLHSLSFLFFFLGFVCLGMSLDLLLGRLHI